jgi:hypothetical protein
MLEQALEIFARLDMRADLAAARAVLSQAS